MASPAATVYGSRDMKGAMEMFKKIKQLTTQVSILTEEIAKADLELLKYEAEYQEHSAALSDANSTVAKLQAQVGHAQTTINKIGDVKQEHEEEDTGDYQLAEQIEECRDEIAKMTNKIDSHKQVADQNEKHAALLEKQIKDTEVQIAEVKAGASTNGATISLEEQAQLLQHKADLLSKQCAEQAAVREDLIEQNTELNKEFALAQRKLLISKEDAEKTNHAEIENNLAQLEQITKETHEKQAELNRLMTEAAERADAEAQKYVVELNELTTRLSQAQNLRDQEATDFVAELYAQKKKRIEGQKIIDKLGTGPEGTEAIMVGCLEDIANLEKEKKEVAATFRQLKNDNKRFQQEAGPLNEELSEQQRTMMELQEQKTTMEKQILTLQKNIKEKQVIYARDSYAKAFK